MGGLALMPTRFLVQAPGSKGRTQVNGTDATALLDAFTSTLPGLAPASGGGTSNFLRADGTWAAPAGGGGVSDGDKGDIVVASSGTVWSLDYTAVNAVIAPVWSNVTSKPTTLAGYGISDGITAAAVAAGYQPLDADLTALAALSGTDTIYYRSAASTWSAVTIGSNLTFSGGTLSASGGGVSDGDKGDIVVSSSGTVWSLDYTAVNATVAPTWGNVTSKPADLTTIAGLSPSNDDFLQRKAGAWVNRTVAQVKTDLGLTGTNSGDQTITLTGDVTGSGTGSFAATLATVNSNTGTFGSATQVAQVTLDAKGRATAAANVTITPDWSNITSKPAAVTALSGTNTGDQTSIVGITGTLAQFNTAVTDADLARTDAANTFTGTQTFGQQQVRTGLTTDPASPADGTDWYDSRIGTFKTVVGSRTRDVLADFIASGAFAWKAVNGATAPTSIGIAAPTATGTATAASIATTNRHTMFPRLEALVTVAATTAVAGFRGTTNLVTLGGASADLGGFRLTIIWGPATGVATSTNRAFVGLSTSTSAPTDVEPSTLVNMIGMGWDAADANIQLMQNDGSGTATKTSTGIAVPAVDRTSVYKLELFSPKGTTQSCQWRVTDMVNGTVADGSVNTNLPGTTTLLSPRGWMSAGGTSSVIGIALMSMYLDPLL